MTKHYVNEVGTDLVLDVGVDISTVTEQHINYRKPDGITIGSYGASLYSSYSALAEVTGTYLLTHSLIAGDFDTPGEWRFQAYVGAVDGTWVGEMVKYQVYDNFE